MPDDLYDRVALAWSEHQAGLLWRGERVNEVDWEHVIEEIEDVGLSELLARGMHRLPKGCGTSFCAIDAPQDRSTSYLSRWAGAALSRTG
jgi:hypothetical protein